MNKETLALEQVNQERNWSALMSLYRERVRFRGYTCRPSVSSAVSDRDGAGILRNVMPGLTTTEHDALARLHEDMAARCKESWSTIVDQAARETFGRGYVFSDYKISGIARSEFTEERKEQLRTLAHAETHHHKAAAAHAYLAKGRMRLH
ncbi:hypothetical protein [Paraburkholderia sp. SIMBA_054]|uniref:hypothetical protein n=1 Tax=Paraburkholderia sp. SIMBA_054 TaxID=3085795 RepID=UPI00397A04E3